MVPDFRRDGVWMSPYQVRGRLLKSGMTEKAVYGQTLINKPDYGNVIRGSGGLRKLRWSAGGHGNRGGIRVVYYWFVSKDTLLLLFAYSKGEQGELTPEQLRQLKKVVEGEYR